jgi:hypothetical protein
MTDPEIVGTAPNQATLYDILGAIQGAAQLPVGAVTNAGLTDLVNVYNQLVNFLAVKVIGPTTVVSGSFTQANANVHPFAAVSTPCGAAVQVVADAANNAAGVLIGGAAPAYPLYPGQTVRIAVNDLANVYYQFGAHAGDKIYFVQSA